MQREGDRVATATSDELSQLIETERRLGAELTKAKEEAGRLVKQAEDQACEREARLVGELDDADDQLRREIEAETRQMLAEVEQRRIRAVAKYDAVPDEMVARLALYVLDRIMGREESTP